jgi:hypothetical protein
MSQYYNPRKTKNLFDPNSNEPFRLSRSKLDLFLKCPRCFYLDRRLGIGQPPGFPFSLNSAVDSLLKKEFDIHRAEGNPHPLMEHYGIDAVPYDHEKIGEWRDALRGGISHHHQPSNFIFFGAIDDVWINPKKELLIVDYKATATNNEITLDDEWKIAYKRQMEIYQWLFRQNGFKVSKTGYFVYCNGDTDKEAFDSKLEFDVHILPYDGDDSWVEGKLLETKKCLTNPKIPEMDKDCDYCRYTKTVSDIIKAST